MCNWLDGSLFLWETLLFVVLFSFLYAKERLEGDNEEKERRKRKRNESVAILVAAFDPWERKWSTVRSGSPSDRLVLIYPWNDTKKSRGERKGPSFPAATFADGGCRTKLTLGRRLQSPIWRTRSFRGRLLVGFKVAGNALVGLLGLAFELLLELVCKKLSKMKSPPDLTTLQKQVLFRETRL